MLTPTLTFLMRRQRSSEGSLDRPSQFLVYGVDGCERAGGRFLDTFSMTHHVECVAILESAAKGS